MQHFLQNPQQLTNISPDMSSIIWQKAIDKCLQPVYLHHKKTESRQSQNKSLYLDYNPWWVKVSDFLLPQKLVFLIQ